MEWLIVDSKKQSRREKGKSQKGTTACHSE
jgi:hypothetical protein